MSSTFHTAGPEEDVKLEIKEEQLYESLYIIDPLRQESFTYIQATYIDKQLYEDPITDCLSPDIQS